MSAIEPSGLALFWAGVIVVAILVYIILLTICGNVG